MKVLNCLRCGLKQPRQLLLLLLQRIEARSKRCALQMQSLQGLKTCHDQRKRGGSGAPAMTKVIKLAHLQVQVFVCRTLQLCLLVQNLLHFAQDLIQALLDSLQLLSIQKGNTLLKLRDCSLQVWERIRWVQDTKLLLNLRYATLHRCELCPIADACHAWSVVNFICHLPIAARSCWTSRGQALQLTYQRRRHRIAHRLVPSATSAPR
mmetsp:Transcript_52842/g.115289  ORF Transcript_52842/g.115289 Transcript_52842/m.115289 type:complete len:208 (+) Transcript_52842:118-741(+)